MLHHGDRGIGKVGRGAPCGVGVHQVVVGKLPTVQLAGAGHSNGVAGRSVESSVLMRVFAVPESGNLLQGNGQRFG